MSDPIRRLIHAFSKLPGIGEKTGARLTFFLLNAEPALTEELAEALMDVRENVRFCSVCCQLTQDDPCALCRDPGRDQATICVVESMPGMMAIEKTGEHRGLYHVLHGVLAPLDGVGPDELHLKELLGRLSGVEEIIVATNPSVEGEATAIYIHRLVSPMGISVTRIASGVPIGSDLEYADQVTLSRALSGRRPL